MVAHRDDHFIGIGLKEKRQRVGTNLLLFMLFQQVMVSGVIAQSLIELWQGDGSYTVVAYRLEKGFRLHMGKTRLGWSRTLWIGQETEKPLDGMIRPRALLRRFASLRHGASGDREASLRSCAIVSTE